MDFADDIVLFADTAENMQAVSEALKEYCNLNQLTVNRQKTNFLICRKGGRNFRNLGFQFGDKEIKIVDSYTSLGISCSRSGLFGETSEQILEKSSIASSSTFSLIKLRESILWLE